MASTREKTLKTANAYLMMSCNDNRSQTEQRENRSHQRPAFSRLHHLRASEEAGGADHRQHQRQGQGNREEIQPATTPRQLQRNHALDRIRKAIEDEAVSYSDIVYLQEHAEEIKQLGDPVLAEWAGIPEDEFMEAQR